VTLAGSIVLKV